MLKALGAFYFIEFFLLLGFSVHAMQKRALIYGSDHSAWSGTGSGAPETAAPAPAEDPVPRAVVVEEPYN